jgi:hypothetical protein
LAVLSAVCAADDAPRLHALNPQNSNLKTGPAVGTKVPPFEAADQNGKTQTFESLRGPKGLVLAFVRSADW